MEKKIIIGIFGYGVVAQGLVHVLTSNHAIDVRIKKICIKNPLKERSLPASFFTWVADDILQDPEINLVVELIDDAGAAYEIVKKALKSGKNVVSANKKMLAFHLSELIEIQKQQDVSLLYEPSSCGSIPIIRNLEEYYDNDLLLSVSGILNGSSNYILSKIFNEKEDYNTALRQAQELGFAESNPIMDVGGFDSLYKLIIITIHAFGVVVQPDTIFNYGIANIASCDILFASEKGYKIKLVAQVKKVNDSSIAMFVMPQLVRPDNYIYNVENQFNGVVLEGLFYDKQFMFGKGAGGNPTGSAVLSDITALLHNYRYEYKKMRYYSNFSFTNDISIKVYLRYYDKASFESFSFQEIIEQYSSEAYSYVVGKTNLKSLLMLRDRIPSMDIFLACIAEP